MTRWIAAAVVALASADALALPARPSSAKQLALAHVNIAEVDALMDLLAQVQKRLYLVEAMRQDIQEEIGDSRCRARSLDQWIKTGRSNEGSAEDLREFADAIQGLQLDLESAGPAYRLRHNLGIAEKKMGALLAVVERKSCGVSRDSRNALGEAVQLLRAPLADFRSALNSELARESSRIALGVNPESRPW